MTNVKESLQTFENEITEKPSVISYTEEQSIQPYVNKRTAKAARKKKVDSPQDVDSHVLDNLCE